MVTVYFLIGIVFLVYEAYVAINPNKLIESFQKCDMEDGNLITIKPLVLIGFFYTIWAVIGMLGSSQFILFMILFIIGCLTWIFKRNATPQQTLNIIVTDAIACFTIVATIMYRHFYHS